MRVAAGAAPGEWGAPQDSWWSWAGRVAALLCAAGFAAVCLGMVTTFLALSVAFLVISVLVQVRRGAALVLPARSFTALAAWSLVGALLSRWPRNALSWWVMGLIACVTVWQLATFPWTEVQHRLLAAAVLAGGAGAAAGALVQFVATGSEAPSGLSHPNRLAAFVLFVWPVGYAWGRGYNTRLARIGARAAGCVMLAGLVVTFSRGGWLGVLAQGIWLFRRRRLRFAVAVLLVLVTITLLLPWEMGGIARTFLPDYRTNLSRLTEWIAALRLVGNNPVWGVGVGNYRRAAAGTSLVPHNLFLHIAAQSGLVGLVLSVSLLSAIWRWLVKRSRTFGAHPWALAAQTAFVGLLVHGMVDF